MSKVNLSKYNIPIRERASVARSPVTGSWQTRPAESSLERHVVGGKVTTVKRAASGKVLDVATGVIEKHHDVIRRLAKR
ncbi:hypothetical protein [Cupriavidus nantongensis]|uniref:hypothetical protein n=1 Tax=Cupriavidus nantongensis TaxID=1796606 RepID=UPI000AD7775C|nr:hypothetical protein [Cupriavidus nantongensis]